MTTTKETRVAALDDAIARGGGIVKFSRALGVTHQAVYDWRKRGWVPLERAVVIASIFKIERDSLIDPRLVQVLAAHDADVL